MVTHAFHKQWPRVTYPQTLEGLGTRIGYLTIVNMYMCPPLTTANMAGPCSKLFEGGVAIM